MYEVCPVGRVSTAAWSLRVEKGEMSERPERHVDKRSTHMSEKGVRSTVRRELGSVTEQVGSAAAATKLARAARATVAMHMAAVPEKDLATTVDTAIAVHMRHNNDGMMMVVIVIVVVVIVTLRDAGDHDDDDDDAVINVIQRHVGDRAKPPPTCMHAHTNAYVCVCVYVCVCACVRACLCAVVCHAVCGKPRRHDDHMITADTVIIVNQSSQLDRLG
jgi:hypothetical protein